MGRVEESVFGLTSQKKKKKGERGAKKLITHIQTHTHTHMLVYGGAICFGQK